MIQKGTLRSDVLISCCRFFSSWQPSLDTYTLLETRNNLSNYYEVVTAKSQILFVGGWKS